MTLILALVIRQNINYNNNKDDVENVSIRFQFLCAYWVSFY